ncbi:MAG: ATPase [Eubacteriales bacterium]|nr:ATPase [Eubacteriales bacterium]
MSIERHYFPGNNTPEGFFSYYRYIMGQREANKIICIKGGPGTGKSTFMKKVGDRLVDQDEDVDFLHCSSDENSLDGIIIKRKNIAIVDGTSPHVIDPITPGAVDNIINFGQYWDEAKLAGNKDDIISYNEECSKWYRLAYSYLAAAKCMYSNLEKLYNDSVEISEIYKLSADIIAKEYRNLDISLKPGSMKRFFASAITSNGNVNYIKTLLQDMKKVYLINVPVGYANSSFMNIIAEGAIYRGFDVEAYYCPMSPSDKIEHIIIPEIKTAFTTVNKWHDLEPWEIFYVEEESDQNIILIDICDYTNNYFMEKNNSIIVNLTKYMDILIDEAVKCLGRAKENHDIVEKMYIKHMNFEKIDQLVEDLISNL